MGNLSPAKTASLPDPAIFKPAPHWCAGAFVLTVWFGLLAGLIEGTLLILFQRMNWRNWGAMLHVSAPIIWISPLVDLILFALVVCLVVAAAKVFARIPR